MIKIIPEREKILIFTQEKFFREGFNRTTIEEIARELNISKNTIYKYFPGKEELLKACIFGLIEKSKIKVDTVINSRSNAIEKLLAILGILSNTIMNFSEKFLRDIQIQTPAIWEQIDEIRKKFMFANIMKIVEQGKKEKLFMDFPTELVLTVFVTSVRAVVNPSFLLNMNYTASDAINTTFRILIRGILTEKGYKIFNNIKSDQ
jgi:AcrR family transcriptional regulator